MKAAFFKYILALLLFGSNGVVASLIGLSSFEIVLLRSFLGSLFLLVIYGATHQKRSFWQHKKDLVYLALSGIAMAADWLLLFEAFTQIGVSLSIVINYCGPILVVALSPLLFKEPVMPQKLIALALALGGMILISGQVVQEGIHFQGLAFAVLSAGAYAAMVIFNKKSTRITGLENATLQLFFTFMTVAIFVGFRQGFIIDLAPRDVWPILWIGFINTGLCCYLYFSSFDRLPVQTVAILGYLEPLAAVLFAVLLLNERLQLIQVLGAVLIIGGAVLAEGATKRILRRRWCQP